MDVIELPGNPFDLKPDLRLEVYYLARLEELASKVRVKQGIYLSVELLCLQGNILDHLNELVFQSTLPLLALRFSNLAGPAIGGPSISGNLYASTVLKTGSQQGVTNSNVPIAAC